MSPIILGWAIWRALAEFKVFTKLRFRLENHLATENDVRKMGLLNGFLMYLGRFFDRDLRLGDTYSVWVLGESGMGKTSGVAIPSILESDKACIAAADDSGISGQIYGGLPGTAGAGFLF